MIILFKNAFSHLFKKPIQILITVLASVFICAACVICLYFPLVLRVNASKWANTFSSGNDIVCTTLGYNETNLHNAIAFSEKAKSETPILDYRYTLTYHYNIETPDNVIRSQIIYFEDFKNDFNYFDIPILETCDGTSSLPEIYITYQIKTKFDLDLHDELTLPNIGKAEITGIVDNFGLAGNDGFEIIFTSKQVNKEETGSINFYFKVKGKGTDQFEENKKEVREYFKNFYFPSISISEAETKLETSVNNTMTIVYIACALIIFVMGFLLYSSYSVIIESQYDDLIKLKAMGTTPFQSSFALIIETMIYALIGTLVGLGGGYLLSEIIKYVMKGSFPSFNVSPDFLTYFYALLISLGVSLIASFIPAYRLVSKRPFALISRKIKLNKSHKLPLVIVSSFIFIASIFFMVFSSDDLLLVSTIIFLVALIIFVIVVTPSLIRLLASLLNNVFKKGSIKISNYHLKNESTISTLVIVSTLICTLLFASSKLFDVISASGVSTNDIFKSDYVLGSYSNLTSARKGLEIALKNENVTDGAITNIMYNFKNEKDTSIDIFGIFIDSEKEIDYVCRDVKDKNVYSRFEETSNGCILSYGLAKKFDLNIGDTFSLTHNSDKFECSNLVVAGIDYFATTYDYRIVAKRGDFDFSNVHNPVYSVLINGNKQAYLELRGELKKQTGVTLFPFDSYFRKTTSSLKTDELILVLEIVVMYITGFGLVDYIMSSTNKRIKNFSSYHLLGMSKKEIITNFLYESIVITLIVAIYSFLLTLLMYKVGPAFALILDRYMYFEFFTNDLYFYVILYSVILFFAWFFVNTVSTLNALKNQQLARDTDFR